MRELNEKIPRVAAAPFRVVIEGESGTGEEFIPQIRSVIASAVSGSAHTASIAIVPASFFMGRSIVG
jgi:DNA-binding NtrC family response regulator